MAMVGEVGTGVGEQNPGCGLYSEWVAAQTAPPSNVAAKFSMQSAFSMLVLIEETDRFGDRKMLFTSIR